MNLNTDILVNPYLVVGVIIVLVLNFIYKTFNSLEQNGFSREHSLDTVILSVVALIIPFILFLRGFNLEALENSLENQIFFLSLLTLVTFIYISSLFRRWSFFKLIDIFSIEISRLYGFCFLFFAAIFQSYPYLITAIVYYLFFLQLKKLYKNRFSNFLKVILIRKDNEISFIGGVGLIFLIYNLLLANLYIIFALPNLYFKEYYLLALAFGLLTSSYTFVKRSKNQGLLWGLQRNLLKSKKPSSLRSVKSLERRLIG